MLRALKLLLMGLFACTPPAYSQSTDSAEVQLSLEVQNAVNLRWVRNRLVFQDHGDGTFRASERFCVTSSLGSYALTVSGTGSGGGFALTSPSNQTVPYSVSFESLFDDADPVELTAGQPASGYTAPRRCLGRNTGEIEFVVQASDIPGSGRYGGRATILIAGE